jgi:hypothetical protein
METSLQRIRWRDAFACVIVCIVTAVLLIEMKKSLIPFFPMGPMIAIVHFVALALFMMTMIASGRRSVLQAAVPCAIFGINSLLKFD